VPNLNQGSPDLVFRFGGADSTTGLLLNAVDYIAAASSTTWLPLPSMHRTRWESSAVLLPDGSVVVIGGFSTTTFPFAREVELFRMRDNPLQWRLGPSDVNFGGPRDYHHGSILLPDGRVFVCGGESRTKDYAILRPYYLDPSYFRTTILTAPPIIRYQNSPGGPYTHAFSCTKPTTFGVTVDKIVLMRPGMSTHHSDYEQKYIELQVVSVAVDELGGSIALLVAGPPTENHAPPGYYMAFAVSTEGVPSKAAWVQLKP
jgi:hypothetical protein